MQNYETMQGAVSNPECVMLNLFQHLKLQRYKTLNPGASCFRRVQGDNNGAGIVETLIVFIVISVLVVVVMSRYEDIAWEARKTALQTELNNLRQAILLFKITKGRYPQALKELITENVVVPYKDTIVREKYLEPYSVDMEMNILDPFDMPFAYDPKTGKVWSQKKGFEHW